MRELGECQKGNFFVPLFLWPIPKAKDQFRRVKQAQNDEQLTVTGLEHYYKQLLVSDGLLVEDATIEASEAYEQWKRNSAISVTHPLIKMTIAATALSIQLAMQQVNHLI